MDLSQRIKHLKKVYGANQEDFLKILKDNGIDATIGTVKGWWQGKTKNLMPKYAIALSNHFKINREWLEHGTGEMTSSSQEQGISLHDLSLIAHTLSDKSLTIPFYEDIKASAGGGCTNDECELQYINLVPNMLPIKNTKHIDAILVSGESMAGTINDNDVIFIDKNQTTPQNGKIFVILMCGEVYVKRVFIDPNTKKLILKSDNALFPQFEASEDCKIIGRVIANMSIKEL